MLPMGTIMASCMIVGVLALPLSKHMPKLINKVAAVVVLLAGLWNTLWYASQHLTEFWGQAALVSGVAMLITSAYMLDIALPEWLSKIKPVVWLLLLACALLYAVTIYRL